MDKAYWDLGYIDPNSVETEEERKLSQISPLSCKNCDLVKENKTA
jgi:hypothetical protein